MRRSSRPRKSEAPASTRGSTERRRARPHPRSTATVNANSVIMKSVADPLLAHRSEFPILSTCTYLVSNSLGAMPAGTRARLLEFADDWAGQGVVAWEKWLPLVSSVGDVVGKIINAPRGSITMLQNVSIAESILISCLDFSGRRNKVV